MMHDGMMGPAAVRVRLIVRGDHAQSVNAYGDGIVITPRPTATRANAANVRVFHCFEIGDVGSA